MSLATVGDRPSTAKDKALQASIDDMQAESRYGETTVKYDDEQLKFIGWCGSAANTSLETPGQTRSLEAPREGEGWVFLYWKEPVDCGAGAAYKIRCRQPLDGPWSDAAMAIESEITLTNQERGKEWELPRPRSQQSGRMPTQKHHHGGAVICRKYAAVFQQVGRLKCRKETQDYYHWEIGFWLRS